jgi:DNA-binding LytR/AlgR family response regulator
MLISENSKNIKISLNSWRFFGYLKIKPSPAMMIQEIPRKIRFGSILMHLLFWVLSLVLFVVLIFLDINMPKLTGLEFLRILKHPPLVIITTAYAEFAIQGYELDVVDYLMKPFGMERFLKAIQKV